MDIVKKLSLNKHPKDNINLSLVNARNIKVSKDESCLTNEESIFENTFIREYLNTFYSPINDSKIVGIIPCNNELVIVVQPVSAIDKADIFRYREGNETQIEDMYCAYGGIDNINRFDYQGGDIKGAFTYNVENSLIISISEYNVPNKRIPLRTINLGNFDDQSVYNDNELPNSLLSVAPELRLPRVNNLQYISGSAYKGWYYLFIRYKINSVDYTQWYSIGFPVYIDTLEKHQIIRYVFNRETKVDQTGVIGLVAPSNPDDGFGVGASDYFSNTTEIARESFKVDIEFNNVDKYSKYQIGVVCASKSYLKSFRTADINLNENFITSGSSKIKQFNLDNKSLIEHSSEDFIIDNYNYFNVKNIINYQNRLYIANYEESTSNEGDIDQTIVNDIQVGLSIGGIRDYGLVYDTPIINKSNDGVVYPDQYDAYRMTLLHMYMYLGVTEDTIITVADDVTTKTDKANRFFISSGNQTPGYAFIEHRAEGPLGSTIKTYFGKDSAKTVSIDVVNQQATNKSTIYFKTRDTAINGGMRYTNTNVGFNDRKKNSCLIPGEVYNFFIHYVDKYGHASNGYRINNNTKWTGQNNPNVEIIPVPFNIEVGGNKLVYYAAVPIDNNVSILPLGTFSGHTINTNGVTFYKATSSTGEQPYLYNAVTAGEINNAREAFISFYNSYADIKFVNYKWYQISYGPDGNAYHLYINNNGERLFKVPMVETFNVGIDGFIEELTDYKSYNIHSLPRASFSNITIPDGYEGYYISYEKFESLQRVTGMLTRNDFRSQDYTIRLDGGGVITESSKHVTANSAKSDKMMFYSSMFDISDSIKMDYNLIRIEGVNIFDKDDIPSWDYYQRNRAFNFVHDSNKPQIGSYGLDPIRTYAIPEYNLAVADSAANNRMGLGTTLLLNDAYNLFPNYDPNVAVNNQIKIYRVTLVNASRNIYMSDSKTLIRLSETRYKIDGALPNFKYSTGVIANGYNGRYTYDGVLVYENAGVIFNNATNKITRTMSNTEYYPSTVSEANPHTYENDIPFFAYVQFPVCTDIIFESKSFKTPPVGILYLTKSENEQNKFATGNMVTPVNSIDLFENRQLSSDEFNIKTYTNYRADLVSIESFNKTIRRSNVIQDETRVNGWRRFPVEGYKTITENKGNITNLVGIGTLLLAHTEHSLFMFDTNNTLRADGQEIQLSQPDAFEVRYKEVFTSDLGFGGLQDSKAFIIDEFGYIFYSNDFNRFYHFDNGQLGMIDDDIIQWLNKYRPYNIRFANDKNNRRILIKMEYFIGGVDKYEVLSYNYNTKTFISLHDYYFDEAYNTKINLYLNCDDIHVGCSLHQFDKSHSSYGKFDNIKGTIGIPTITKSKLSVIINVEFRTVKYLEYISYKLTKYVNDAQLDFTNSPVEEYKVPYSGNTLSVYNDNINTGLLDITVDQEESKNAFSEFDKPYWDLGVWNYSYLRNKVSELDNLSATEMSRLFGNYFVIEFEFNNADERRIEFEELDCNLIKD